MLTKRIWIIPGLTMALWVAPVTAVLIDGSTSVWTTTAMAADVLKAGRVDPKTGKTIKYWVAPMDPTYIRDAPGKSPMGMDLVPVYAEDDDGEKTPSSTIRIDPVTRQNMGVRLGRVERRPLSKTIRTFGTIAFDETGVYSVNTKFNGWIETLHVDYVGETVKKGQPLFDIYSPDLLTAQQEYLIALRQFNATAGGKQLLEAPAPAWPTGTSPTRKSRIWSARAPSGRPSPSSRRHRAW